MRWKLWSHEGIKNSPLLGSYILIRWDPICIIHRGTRSSSATCIHASIVSFLFSWFCFLLSSLCLSIRERILFKGERNLSCTLLSSSSSYSASSIRFSIKDWIMNRDSSSLSERVIFIQSFLPCIFSLLLDPKCLLVRFWRFLYTPWSRGFYR